MWWKKKKHGQQQDQQLHEIPIDLVLTDDLYWIFQFCNPFKPLKVALIEQAIVTWGQVVPDCIAHAPAHTDVYLQFPPQARYQHQRSAAANKDDSVRALPATSPAHRTTRPVTESPAAPSAVCCQPEAKHSTPRQALLAAATAELAGLHELMLGCADLEKQTDAALECDDTDDIQLQEMHAAACTCFSGLLGSLLLASASISRGARQLCSYATGKRRLATAGGGGSASRNGADSACLDEELQYQEFLRRWRIACQQPPWQQRPASPPARWRGVSRPVHCSGSPQAVLQSHPGGVPERPTCILSAQQHQQQGMCRSPSAQTMRQQSTRHVPAAVMGRKRQQGQQQQTRRLAQQVQAAEEAIRQARLQLHLEQNAWGKVRWEDGGEAAALERQRVLQEHVLAAQEAHKHLVAQLRRQPYA